MFVSKSGEELTKRKGDIDGKNFKIRDLKDCTVYLLDFMTGLFIDDCENCTLYLGPCDGSVFIRTSKNCSISVISKQLRFRDCFDLNIYSFSITDPIIETSNNICFGPYNFAFPSLGELFTKANFSKENENKFNIYDFSPEEGNPHWKFIESDSYKKAQFKGENPSDNEFLYDGYEKVILEFTGSDKINEDGDQDHKREDLYKISSSEQESHQDILNYQGIQGIEDRKNESSYVEKESIHREDIELEEVPQERKNKENQYILVI